MNNIQSQTESDITAEYEVDSQLGCNLHFAILENLPYIVFVYDIETRTLIYINKTGELISGYSKKDIVGKKINKIFTDNFVEYDINVMLNEKPELEPVEIGEWVIRTKNHENKFLFIKRSVIADTKGVSKYILIIGEDVTIRKKEELEITRNKLRFFRLFESSPIAISFVNAFDNAIIDINTRHLEMLGYNREDVIGKKALEMDMWAFPEQRDYIIAIAKQKRTAFNQEVQLKHKNGDIITVLMSVEYMPYDEGDDLLLFMALDITDRKKLDIEIKNALEKERDLNILKTSFISMISHEFRTPLTTIMLSTDLLKRYGTRWTEEERLKHFQRIQDTVLKMTQLMENVLTIGRLEAGKFDYHPEPLDLPAFCSTIVENIEFNTLGKNKINLTFLGGVKDIRADENLLWLIISNLLTNAIKYSPKNSEVNFEVRFSDDNVKLKISDHGIGIPNKDLENLFQIFYRATNVGVTSGYGLGLNIVKRCIEAHSGTIKVESVENQGTTFIVEIPIKNENY